VILPLTILRRLDCVLEPDREAVWELARKFDNPNRLKAEVKKATGTPFYKTLTRPRAGCPAQYGFARDGACALCGG
jgi:hypothetical protein